MTKKDSAFLGFLIGAAAGLTFGMLYAPEKGNQTRNRLSYRLDKYRNFLSEFFNDLLDGTEDAVSSAKLEEQKINVEVAEKVRQLEHELEELKNRNKLK